MLHVNTDVNYTIAKHKLMNMLTGVCHIFSRQQKSRRTTKWDFFLFFLVKRQKLRKIEMTHFLDEAAE